jgi:hypothetical protein
MKATTGSSSVARVLVLLATTACLLWKEAACFSASGMNKAFATFYGGSDASGTMGKYVSKKIDR